MPVVIDASALVELLLQSDRRPRSSRPSEPPTWSPPDAINPEVLSTLRRFERIGELRAGRAMQAVDDLLEADVRRFPTLPLLPESWALRASLTPHDACCVALARNLGCPLVTGDRRLSRAPGLGVPLVTV
jgi:predicted nucleic acid-binding protein